MSKGGQRRSEATETARPTTQRNEMVDQTVSYGPSGTGIQAFNARFFFRPGWNCRTMHESCIACLELVGRTVHISVVCPRCLSRYFLEPSMKGQKMRCPNSSCREIFEVKEEPAEAPSLETSPDVVSPLPGPSKQPDEYTLGDAIPFLPVERLEEVDSPQPISRPNKKEPWSSPSENRPSRANPRSTPKSVSTPFVEPGVQQVLDWRQQAPPPRPQAKRGVGFERSLEEPFTSLEELNEAFASEAGSYSHPRNAASGQFDGLSEPNGEATDAEAAAVETKVDEEYVERPHRRKLPLVMALIVTVFLVAGGFGLFVLLNQAKVNEESLANKAKEQFNNGNFKGAAETYQKLVDNCKESESWQEYIFFTNLSKLRSSLGGFQANSVESAKSQLNETADFVAQAGSDPLFTEEQKRPIGNAVFEIALNSAKEAQQSANADSLTLIDEFETALFKQDLARRLLITADQRSSLNAAFGEVRVAVAKVQQRDAVLAQLRALAARPSVASIKEAQQLIRKESAAWPSFDKLEDVTALLNQLYDGHRQQIVFTPGAPNQGPIPNGVEREGGLIVDPLLVRSEGPLGAEDRILPALARGVLYALSQNSGKVQWARRVGMDVTVLPLRLPAGGGKPERLLLPSTDSSVLLALDARDGGVLWQVRLSGPILGKPLVVGPNAYVATADGRVFEVNHFDGQIIGHFNLGQRLTMPGTRMEDTNLLFFPAEEYCVFILDSASHSLHAILYTEHPAGALLGQASVVRTDKQQDAPSDPSGYLILPMAAGLEALQLQTFLLPLGSPTAKPLTTTFETRLRGWPWFAAHQDAEKLIQVTDAGQLGFFGLPQPFNTDGPLFPLVGNGIFDLGSIRPPAPGTAGAGSNRGRAQVAYAQEGYVWILAQGQLDCFKLSLQRDLGPRLIPAWAQPVALGTPLQETQIDQSNSTLFLVTQPPNGRTCVASAVEADTGRIIWQRQLGFISQGALLPITGKTLGLDQGGGLCEFDPSKMPRDKDLAWRTLANNWVAKPDLQQAPHPGYLLADGVSSALAIFSTNKGTDLVVRRYEAKEEGKSATVTDFNVNWADRKGVSLAGSPAVNRNLVLLPLDNGAILRLDLSGEGKAGQAEGPTWRSANASPTARGFVAWISNEEFVTSNGGSGITRWRWPLGGTGYSAVIASNEANVPDLSMEGPIATIPLVIPLPTAQDKDNRSLCVADETGKISLYQIMPDKLELIRSWPLGAKITAGPFVRGSSIGCVVDQNILIWIDPAKGKPEWTFATKALNASLVGEPQLVDNSILVADQSGLIQALDPKSGRPRNSGYRFRTISGPAASPVSFGPGRALVPLTDGTLVLLPLEKLGEMPPKMAVLPFLAF
jgi:outer membrane protein assembly factor BamB